MHVFMHDFAGYPYPIQLSRALARRGHRVTHVYCGSLRTTPGGALCLAPDDPTRLQIQSLHLDEPIAKYALVKRWRQENQYGRLVAREVERVRPDVVVSANAPLDAQRWLLRRCRRLGVPFVFWVQDLIGVASQRLLQKKLPLVGSGIGTYYEQLERRMLRQSDQVVLITDDFRPLLRQWSVPEARMHTIENWAPLEELPCRPKTNAWSRAHGLDGKCCLLYAGTLGMKHNPDLLLRLALRLRDRPDVRVVVVSQGLGADWLRAQKRTHGLDTLVLLDFVSFERMPDVMAAADVLLALLEPDAGVFSVPSKVLAYLCAARPIVLAVPPENLAARIVREHEAGIVVPPTDVEGFVKAATTLADDPARRLRFGQNARAYAEKTFRIETIADAFERVLEQT